MTGDPAEVAALLRQHLARLDTERRTRCALIKALDAYSYQLKATNMMAGKLAGDLRRAAAHYDADAERLRRQLWRVAPAPARTMEIAA